MTRPISVVLCTYNGSLFLAEQVRSILLQTYPITELIIADDASTDNTYELIQAPVSYTHLTLPTKRIV